MKIIRRLTPQPLTPAQEEARLLHKLALLEGRIAERATWNPLRPKRFPSGQLDRIRKQRDTTLLRLSQIRGEAKEAINQTP